MKHSIDDAFVNQLFSHPTFQQRLFKTYQNSTSLKKISSPPIAQIIEEITVLLSEEFKQKVNSDCSSIYQSHAKILKQIQQIKNNLYTSTPTKTTISTAEKDKIADCSLLSEVDLDFTQNPNRVRKNGQENDKLAGASFMNSFLSESRIKESKEELQERINATIINISGDVAKFQSSVEERLRKVEVQLNRKIDSIFKTFASVFESLNDLQQQYNDKLGRSDIKKQRITQKSEIIDKIKDQKFYHKDHSQKQKHVSNNPEQNVKRRSFLGIIKY